MAIPFGMSSYEKKKKFGSGIPYDDFPSTTATGNTSVFIAGRSKSKRKDPLEEGLDSLDDYMRNFEQIQARAREEVSEAYRGALDTTDGLQKQIMASLENDAVDVGALTGEYRQSIDESISRMTLAAEKNAEFQSLQVQGAARSGSLGANAFAVARETSAMIGRSLAQTLGAIAEVQKGAADTVANLVLQGENINLNKYTSEIGVLANLAGTKASLAMNYGGIVSGAARATGDFIANIANLSTSLRMAQANTTLDIRKINASLAATKVQANAQRELELLRQGFEREQQERSSEETGRYVEEALSRAFPQSE